MIQRHLADILVQDVARNPVVTLTGPRQSGKTTLVRAVFPEHAYLSLEDPAERRMALEDPRAWLGRFNRPIIIDEAQRAPELFSYLQLAVDADPRPGRFILTGSQNFLLLSGVSQSLAGRCAVRHLLPFSLDELHRRLPIPLERLGKDAPVAGRTPAGGWLPAVQAGFYPAIHDRGLTPSDWLAGYQTTYVERDVRLVLNIGDLGTFQTFLGLCAGRCGQLLNLSSLAADCGISHTTARRWISVLEASFIVTLLRPHHASFNKRLVKTPKLYFLDTGLLCNLLSIRKPDELAVSPHRGAIFESFVVAELVKRFHHAGEVSAEMWFWRDTAGHEIDILVGQGAGWLLPVEVKSGLTVPPDAFRGLDWWRTLTGQPDHAGMLVHGGEQGYTHRGYTVCGWGGF